MRNFTEDQVIFREAYRKFLAVEIAPHMEEWREAGIVDRSAFKKAGDLGFLMIWPEEKYGGTGDADFRYEQIIIEETARSGCKGWYNTLHSRLVGPYFKRFGTEEQRDRFLPNRGAWQRPRSAAPHRRPRGGSPEWWLRACRSPP